MADGKIGVLSDRELASLFATGAIKAQSELDHDQIQPASLDLRLGFEAHRIRASFLPGDGRKVSDVL
ncbi:MAG: 2'-deoxycytidine 5'-triphosphate deaminase, partial [Hyphomonas sp.]|nr:2'-deoxycytidine 5'-triphosphate deaminase [Hyphomonas sp.]